MGRRHRHLNPKHLGATRAWDARTITGVSSGSGLETWIDRCGSGDATQSNASFRPTFTENNINGQPSVQFASPNRMEFTFVTIDGDYAIFSVVRSTAGQNMFIVGGGEASKPFSSTSIPSRIFGSGNRHLVFFNKTGPVRRIDTTEGDCPPGLHLISHRLNGADAADAFTRRFGTLLTDSLITSSNPNFDSMHVGAIGALFSIQSLWLFSVGDIGSVSVFVGAGNMTRSLEKRMEHHYAFSYKLASN